LNKGFRSQLHEFNATVRVPEYLQLALKQVHAAVKRLGDPEASVQRIAVEADLRESTVALARTATRRTRSLDAPLDGPGGTHTLASELAQPDDEISGSLDLESRSIESGVQFALESLTDDERCVVELRFGLGDQTRHSYHELAEDLGLSLEEVRRVLARSMAKMRTPRMLKLLEPLLA
jgi:RNA polymerase sigma factor (sigma-70 family)